MVRVNSTKNLQEIKDKRSERKASTTLDNQLHANGPGQICPRWLEASSQSARLFRAELISHHPRSLSAPDPCGVPKLRSSLATLNPLPLAPLPRPNLKLRSTLPLAPLPRPNLKRRSTSLAPLPSLLTMNEVMRVHGDEVTDSAAPVVQSHILSVESGEVNAGCEKNTEGENPDLKTDFPKGSNWAASNPRPSSLVAKGSDSSVLLPVDDAGSFQTRPSEPDPDGDLAEGRRGSRDSRAPSRALESPSAGVTVPRSLSRQGSWKGALESASAGGTFPRSLSRQGSTCAARSMSAFSEAVSSGRARRLERKNAASKKRLGMCIDP
jgi:hypothetical protein